METANTRLKFLSSLLSLIILLQGCVVYQKSPTSLEAVSQEKIRTKVETIDGKTQKFKHVVFEAGTFYGIKQVSGKLVKIPLNKEDIESIYAKNKTASTVLTLTPLVLITGLFVVVAASGGPSIGSIGW